MFAHQRHFGFRETAGFEQHRVGDGHFANVMNDAGTTQGRDVLRLEADRKSQLRA
jgi:hypothetical protein